MGVLQIKLRGRAALRGHWQTALLIALIVNLPSLLIQGIFASLSSSDQASGLTDILLSSLLDTGTTGNASLADQLRGASLGANLWLMPLLTVLSWLILTPFLELGMTHWTLDRLRGAEEPVSTVFSRISIFFKSIGLRLAVSMRVLLWALPGLALCVLSLVLLLTAEVPAAEETASVLASNTYAMDDLFPLFSLFLLLFYMGLMGMIVLGFMSWLRFSQSDFILADEPGESVSSCLSRSKQMMGRRKGSLIGLIMTFAPLYLFVVFGASLPEMLFGGNFGSILSLLLQMLGTLALSVSVLSARGAYYENLRAVLSQALVEPVEASVGNPEDSASNDSSDAD